MLNKLRQTGITLIELMIAILLGLLVVAAAVSVYGFTVKDQSDNLRLIELNQDMRAIMDLIVRDVRRAGFVTTDPENHFACLKNNPFATLAVLEAGTANAGNSCILFSYNRNNNIAEGCTVESSEFYGYRSQGGTLQMKKSGAVANAQDCAGGFWESVNEENVSFVLDVNLNNQELNITEMFTDGDNRCDPGQDCNICEDGKQCLTVRTVNIELQGTLPDGTSQTLSERLRVRNDLFESAH